MHAHLFTGRDGFALADLLVTLCCCAVLVPIAASCIVLLPQLIVFEEDVQDETALYQLRRILMMAYDAEIVSDDTLTFTYREKEWRLHETNRRLILQPGTQIFLSGIDSAFFTEEEEVIYVVYDRDGKQRKAPLCRR